MAGLAISASPSDAFGSDDRFGLILHPLFPHVHGDLRHAAVEAAAVRETSSDDIAMRVSQVEQAPGISAGSSESGGRDVVAGIVLPLVLAGLSVEIARRRLTADLSPQQRSHRGFAPSAE